jgi:hypothetical protein
MKKLLLAILCLTFIFVSACNKCPFMNKISNKSSFSIIDTRIGTGVKSLEVYKNKFEKKDIIWIAYDVKNITGLVEGNDVLFWIRQDLAIKDINGNIIVLKPGVIEIKDKTINKPLRFVNQIDLSNLDIKPGKYTAIILATDMTAFKTSQEIIEFKVLK